MSATNNFDGTYDPKHLGQPSRSAIHEIDRIPWRGEKVSICLECSEFTSLCPVTGQPDFGELTIRYIPGAYIVETKSLKLFLMRYRDMGIFNEAIVDELAATLYRQIAPQWIEITGHFKSRGGISITVSASRPCKTPDLE